MARNFRPVIPKNSIQSDSRGQAESQVVQELGCQGTVAQCQGFAHTVSNPGGSLEATRRSFNRDFLLALAAEFNAIFQRCNLLFVSKFPPKPPAPPPPEPLPPSALSSI